MVDTEQFVEAAPSRVSAPEQSLHQAQPLRDPAPEPFLHQVVAHQHQLLAALEQSTKAQQPTQETLDTPPDLDDPEPQQRQSTAASLGIVASDDDLNHFLEFVSGAPSNPILHTPPRVNL
jgi:hypothetical protein